MKNTNKNNKEFSKQRLYSITTVSTLLVFFLFLIIAYNVQNYEKNQITKLFHLHTNALIKEMKVNLEQYKLEIERMAHRQARFHNMTKEEFLIDSKKHLEDHNDLSAIEWADENDTIQWRYPIKENTQFIIGTELSWDSKREQTIQKIKTTKTTQISQVIDLIEGGKGFMLASPMYIKDQYKGAVIYLFHINKLFEKMLDGKNFAVSIYENDTLLYQMEKVQALGSFDSTSQNIHIFGTNWEIRIFPTIAYIKEYEKNISYLIILFGAFFSIFIGSIVYLQLTKRNQSIKLTRAKEKLQEFMDNQQSLVLHIKEDKIKYMNKPFLNFLGYSTLKELLESHFSLIDSFVQNDIYFHKDKIEKETPWIDSLKTLSSENQIVCMMSQYFEPRAFHVNITDYSDNSYLMNFTDISETILKKIEFENKATSDKLTGLHNREYFNSNIDKYIKKSVEKEKYLGLIIYDIDKFKSVNDTYGHNRGDEVLKQMAKITKKNIDKKDMLIRWGGEEFIIIKLVKSIDEIQEFAEDIRKAIETSHFEEVKKITSSFGVTVYVLGENITDTIERADEALYRAKKSGRNRVEINN